MVCTQALLPAGEIPSGRETVAGDTLAITTVVAFINLAGGAGVLGEAAAQLGAIFSLQTFTFVEAVAFTAPCSHTHTHTHNERCTTHIQCPRSEIEGALTVLALIPQEVLGTLAGRLVSAADRAVASVLAVILTGVQVTGRPGKARQASARRRACGQPDSKNKFNLRSKGTSSEGIEPGFVRVMKSELIVTFGRTTILRL